MKTVEFISHLQSLDVKLFLQDGELKCNAPQGVMNQQIVTELKAQKQAIIAFLKAIESTSTVEKITIGKRPNSAQAPMSYAQQRLWLLQQIDQHSTAYNGLSAFNLKGEFNLLACQNAWQQLIGRHEVLRTNFVERDGQLIQLIKGAELFAVNNQQITQDELPTILNQLTQRVFDLQNDGLISVDVLTLSAQEQVMVVNMHHIICDGWSVSIMIDEFTKLYQGFVNNVDVQLPPMAIQYGDFAHWQRENISPEQLQKQVGYWQDNLAELPALIELATDYPRPAEQSYRGETFEFTLDASRYKKVKKLAEQADSSVFMVMLSAYNILLSAHSSKQDIVVGTPMANRVSVDLEKTIGMFMNTLVLRNQLDNSQSFRAHLDAVRDNTFAAFEHQDLPFEQLVDVLNPPRSLSFSPLFQVMFILQNTPTAKVALPGLTMTALKRADHTAKYDLSLEVTESPDSCHCVFEYSTDLFKQTTIAALRDHWLQILDFACATPNESLTTLSLLTDNEKQQLAKWNNTGVQYDRNTPIHHLIDQQALISADNIACTFEDQQLSYHQLRAKANQLAHYLIDSGVKKGDLIGVGMRRSNDMLVSVLAILKAGAAYVPMDPTYPADRIAYMADDSQVTFIICDSIIAPQLFGERDNVLLIDQIDTTAFATTSPNVQLNSNDLAYVIYTSGSTGKPKGVMIEHANVVNFLQGMLQKIDLSSGTWLALTSLSFDISVLELLCTLATGMKVVIAYDQKASQAKTVKHLDKAIDFSLYYFGNSGQNKTPTTETSVSSAFTEVDAKQYDLLLKGAQFADQHGFHAVWTPERHFGEFGGLYPNPVITSAALASITTNIQIRAGSIVLPLHNVIRVAEDWSVIDNISNGRIGMAIASGWQPDDFAISPDYYHTRHQVMWDKLEQVKALWRGDAIEMIGGLGQTVPVKTLPRPIQHQVPFWITAAGNPDTFKKAGQNGTHLLTHLLGQSAAELAEKITIYREAWQAAGHEGDGYVTLMLHTFVSDDEDFVLQQAKQPFKNYLKSAIALLRPLAQTVGLDFDQLSEDDIEVLLEHGFNRYYSTSGLFGTPESCVALVDDLKGIGINEIGCLLDFGIDANVVLDNLVWLNELRINTLPKKQHVELAQYGIAQLMAQHQVSHFQCTPSLAAILMADDQISDQLKQVKHIYLGGEPLSIQLLDRLAQFTDATVTNMYGPTETTIWSAVHQCSADDKTVPIGKPIANTQIFTLDSVLRQTPLGVPGEIVIAGDGVVRGYHNRPDLTAKQFIHLDAINARAYRTGDLGCWNANGELQILGRIDNQVKVNGFRIELGEIESTIRSLAYIADVVVMVNTDDKTAMRIVAYLVVAANHDYNEQTLLKALRHSLPNFMVPTMLLVIDAIPLTPNGKVNRGKLPSPEAQAIPVGQYIAAQNDIEQQLVDVWQHTLERESIGTNDNFFAVGGNSIRATMTVARVRKELDIDVPVRQLFDNPTIAEFALVVESASANNKQQNNAILPVVSKDDAVLSFAQQRMWFMEQLEGVASAYNEPQYFQLDGPLNIAALKNSFSKIIERHTILRTAFVEKGNQVFQLVEQPYDFDLPVYDSTPADIDGHVDADVNQPFDLFSARLIRARLLRLSDENHVLLLNMHHIVADGWSYGVLLRELLAFYQGEISGVAAQLPAMPIQYLDYSVWQRNHLSGEILAQHNDYWTAKLAGSPPLLSLPNVKERPSVQTYNGDVVEVALSTDMVQSLNKLAVDNNTTLFMCMLSAVYVLVNRLTNTDDIVLGTDVANRNRQETEGLIGFFINLLALRVNLAESPSFTRLLAQVRNTTLDAYNHQEFPFEKVVEAVKPPRNAAYHPIIQFLVAMQNEAAGQASSGDLTMTPKSLDNDVSRFDIGLYIVPTETAVNLKWNFNTDLYTRETIQIWSANYIELLSSIIANPQTVVEHLNIVSQTQRDNAADARKARKQQKLGKARFGKTKTIDNNKSTEVVN